MKTVKITLLAASLSVLSQHAFAQNVNENQPVQATATFDNDKEPDTSKVPFSGYDLTWQNGNDRRDHAALQNQVFLPDPLCSMVTTPIRLTDLLTTPLWALLLWHVTTKWKSCSSDLAETSITK